MEVNAIGVFNYIGPTLGQGEEDKGAE